LNEPHVPGDVVVVLIDLELFEDHVPGDTIWRVPRIVTALQPVEGACRIRFLNGRMSARYGYWSRLHSALPVSMEWSWTRRRALSFQVALFGGLAHFPLDPVWFSDDGVFHVQTASGHHAPELGFDPRLN